ASPHRPGTDRPASTRLHPDLLEEAESSAKTAASRQRGVDRGLWGQFPAQADPAVAVAADRELGQVDVAVVAVGEHFRGRFGNVVEAADVDGGVLVGEVVQEQHGAGRVVGAVREYAGRGG